MSNRKLTKIEKIYRDAYRLPSPLYYKAIRLACDAVMIALAVIAIAIFAMATGFFLFPEVIR